MVKKICLKDKWCVLIKDKKTNLKHLKFLNSFWKKIGSKSSHDECLKNMIKFFQ